MQVLRPGQRILTIPGHGLTVTQGRATLHAGGAAWWLSGGVSAANAIAVYQPKGAASLAASYSNLANPGTYDAAPGTAPDFATATGWTFLGTAYLTTGVVPSSGWSMFCRFSDGSYTGSIQFVCGETPASGNTALALCPFRSTADDRIYYNGGLVATGVRTAAGIMAVAGQQGYLDGSPDGAAIGAWSGTSSLAIFIGARNNNGSANAFWAGKVQAFALYNTALSAAQVAAVSAAMAAL